MSLPAAAERDTGALGHIAMSGHIIVCGLNDVGVRIVEQLSLAGERVLVVSDSGNTRLARIVATLGVAQLAGDPRRHATLAQAGLHRAASLISVEDDDLQNLEIALLARDMAPELRVVVQLSNVAVGRAVARLTGPGSVLDVAALAAPSFVESCLGRHEHDLDVSGHEFRVIEEPVTEPGTLREVFGDLAPIAVVVKATGTVEVCPGRDLTVVPGDRVTLLGAASELRFRHLDNFGRARAAGLFERLGQRVMRVLTTARQFISETERAMRLTVLTLLLVAALSVELLLTGFKSSNGGQMKVLDAIYFTTETLTTVGFGDFYFARQSDWLRVWAIFLMIFGATLVTILYAMLTNLLITRRLAATAGRRTAATLRGHVILIGLGSVGYGVLEGLLRNGVPVLVVESDDDNRYLAAARQLGVPVIIGDATLPQTLLSANLAKASAVALLTSNDLVNIETGLAVDDLLGERRGEVPVVLRVFDRQLASTIEKGFSFQHVRSTSALAAPWFVGAALGLTILSTFYVDAIPFLVGRLTVASGGGLDGAVMGDLSARTRVIAINRQHSGGGLEYPPRRDTRFEAGDQAFVVGPYEELLRLLRHERDTAGLA